MTPRGRSKCAVGGITQLVDTSFFNNDKCRCRELRTRALSSSSSSAVGTGSTTTAGDIIPPNTDGVGETTAKMSEHVGHNFPDFVERWDRDAFQRVGYGMSAATVMSFLGPAAWFGLSGHPVTFLPGVVLGALTAGYWRVGKADISQQSHAIRRNYPVLGNMRYILETVRCRCSKKPH